MAALTWREVSAPDVSGALQGYNQFSALLNNALGQAREGLNRVDSDISAEANNKIALAALAEQDPAKLKAALESGTILAGADPRRVSAQTIAMLSQRPGQLLQQANQEQALTENRYNFTQQQTADARAPQLAQLRALAQADDQTGMAAYVAANPGLLEGLGYKTVSDFQSALQNDTRGAVNIAGGRQDIVNSRDSNARAWNQDKRSEVELGFARNRDAREQGRYNWEGEDRAAGNSADTFLTSFRGSVDPSNPESMRNAVFNSPAFSRLPAKAQAAVFGRLDSQFPGWFNPSEFGVSGGAGGSPYSASTGSMSPFEAILSNEGGIDPKTGAFLRSSAGAWGPSQLMPTTAPEAMVAAGYGRNDQRWKTDADINRKAGQAYYNQMLKRYGGDTVKAAAAYNAGPGKFDKAVAKARKAGNANQWYSFLPDETKKYVRNFQAKTGGGSTSATLAGNAIRTGQDRMGKSDSGELISAAQSGPTTLSGAVGQLRTDPAFAGVSSKFLNGRINDIVNQSKVNGRPTITYGQAGVILRDSMENPESLKEFAAERDKGGGLFNIYRARNPFNDQFIKDEIARQSGQGLVQDNERTLRTQQKAVQISAANDRLAQATSTLQSLLSRSVTQGGLNNPQGNGQSAISLARARVAAAQTALDAARRDGDTNTGQVTRPVATTAGSPSTSLGGIWSELFNFRREPR